MDLSTLFGRPAPTLLEIGFDGFGYGGWPIDQQGNLLIDMIAYLRELVPQAYPLHALGIGHPENVAASFRAGWQIFDSALPTTLGQFGAGAAIAVAAGPAGSGHGTRGAASGSAGRRRRIQG